MRLDKMGFAASCTTAAAKETNKEMRIFVVV